MTFATCPHCRHLLSSAQLTSFSTRGNQSFFSLIKSQFMVQPPVSGKDGNPEKFPNQGRKVLLFSDSRQRAAKLARDMSDSSDIEAARQLFGIAIEKMEKSSIERSMNDLYDYFCIAAAENNVQIFHGQEREKFKEDCDSVLSSYRRSMRRRREYSPRLTMANAPQKVQEYLIRLYAGGYNTLIDSGLSWLEPVDEALFNVQEELQEKGIDWSEEELLEFFNAWILSVCDTATALGHTISDDIRLKVRPNYGGYGLEKNWFFSKEISDIYQWDKQSKEARTGYG